MAKSGEDNPLLTQLVEPNNLRKFAAEFIGTLALIYIGVLAIVLGGNLLVVALAHGLTIAVMASAVFNISGGQLNPAVTIGLLVGRRINALEATSNIVAQLLGGIVGGYLALASVDGVAIPLAFAAGTPALAPTVSVGTGILIETILTFFLMFVIYGTAVEPGFGGRLGALAIGLTVTLDILAGGPLTGAAMNPARWLGSAVPAGQYLDAAVYFVGPILGAVLAGLLWSYVLLPKRVPPESVA